MGFEVFDKRMAPLSHAPSITIQKRGIFSINRAAYSLIGDANTVELLYDRDARVIGIRPTSDSSPHAYAIRPQNAMKSTGPVILSATAFTQYYRIDTTVSRRWTPILRDGVLCIELEGPSVEIVGNRSSKRTSGDRREERDHSEIGD